VKNGLEESEGDGVGGLRRTVLTVQEEVTWTSTEVATVEMAQSKQTENTF
jgi:hypothetical protein